MLQRWSREKVLNVTTPSQWGWTVKRCQTRRDRGFPEACHAIASCNHAQLGMQIIPLLVEKLHVRVSWLLKVVSYDRTHLCLSRHLPICGRHGYFLPCVMGLCLLLLCREGELWNDSGVVLMSSAQRLVMHLSGRHHGGVRAGKVILVKARRRWRAKQSIDVPHGSVRA